MNCRDFSKIHPRAARPAAIPLRYTWMQRPPPAGAGAQNGLQPRENSMSYRIAVLAGSLRRDSFNRQLASALQGLAPKGLQLELLRIDDLPPYNQDDDNNPAPPVRRLKGEIANAQGVIFVTPEYNRSIPGVLKNAIDHASRPYGQSAWAGKPAGVIGISIGSMGTSMAQQHLRNILAYLDMPTMGQPEAFLTQKPGFFDAGGGIGEEGTRQFLQKWLERYAEWVRQYAEAEVTV
jgi:chromate reductase